MLLWRTGHKGTWLGIIWGGSARKGYLVRVGVYNRVGMARSLVSDVFDFRTHYTLWSIVRLNQMVHCDQF